MTELSFLIDLLLNHKLSKEVKALVAERIKLIESQPQVGRPLVQHIPQALAQAPSTMANLNKDHLEPMPPILGPQVGRIVGGEIDTGKGTRGPRKF